MLSFDRCEVGVVAGRRPPLHLERDVAAGGGYNARLRDAYTPGTIRMSRTTPPSKAASATL